MLRTGLNRPIPSNATEFAQHFTNSTLGAQNRADTEAFRDHHRKHPELKADFIASAQSERANHARLGSAYTISVPMQVAAVMTRRVQIIKGNSAQLVVILG